jgi:hypothetical protein
MAFAEISTALRPKKTTANEYKHCSPKGEIDLLGVKIAFWPWPPNQDRPNWGHGGRKYGRAVNQMY